MAVTIADLAPAAESPTSRAICAFLAFCRMEKGLSQNSLAAYSRDLVSLRVFSEPLNGGDLPDEEVLQSYLNHLYRKDLTPRSIARSLSAVRSFFHFLVAEEIVATDPTENL